MRCHDVLIQKRNTADPDRSSGTDSISEQRCRRPDRRMVSASGGIMSIFDIYAYDVFPFFGNYCLNTYAKGK